MGNRNRGRCPLGKQPKRDSLMDISRDDILAYLAFPRELWTGIRSANPLEQVNRGVKPSTAVVGIFLNNDAITRLVGALMLETNDEWTAPPTIHVA